MMFMKLRCTICGAPNESRSGFDTVFCRTCGSAFPAADALEYRLSDDVAEILGAEEFVKLAKEAYASQNTAPQVLSLLRAAAPSGDAEINYLIGMHLFNDRAYSEAIPYLFASAERMYPDGICLYAAAKYLQDPDDESNFPRIRKYLIAAKETCSKVFVAIDGDKLLDYVNSKLDKNFIPQKNPDFSLYGKIPTVK